MPGKSTIQDLIARMAKKAQEIIKSYEIAENRCQNSAGDGIIKEWDESLHPRDDNGRFAGGAGKNSGKYNPAKIIGTTTSTGSEVKNVSIHAQERMHQRHITANKVARVLNSKDSVISDGNNGNTLYFKDNVRVVYDPSTETVVTCIRRSKP